jgi:hypothetical protein
MVVVVVHGRDLSAEPANPGLVDRVSGYGASGTSHNTPKLERTECRSLSMRAR